MPPPQVILIAAAAALLWLGGHEVVKVVKKVSRETVCVVKHGHFCAKK